MAKDVKSVPYQQKDAVIQKNGGVYPGTMRWFGKTVPVPMTTNFDVITIAAYYFTRMREFYLSKELQVYGYQSVASEGGQGEVWHKTDGLLGTKTGIDAPAFPAGSELGLDIYLALPGFNKMDSTRDDPSVRFCPDKWAYESVWNAAYVRTLIENGHRYPTGWLTTFNSKYQKLSDSVRDTYNNYLYQGVGIWDSFIDAIFDMKKYYVLPKVGTGEFYGDFLRTKKFWETVARAHYWMATDEYRYQSQLGWSDWADNAGKAVKQSAETIVQEGAKATGDVAAWAANQAGQATGGFAASFLENVGLWGLAFVAILIAFR